MLLKLPRSETFSQIQHVVGLTVALPEATLRLSEFKLIELRISVCALKVLIINENKI